MAQSEAVQDEAQDYDVMREASLSAKTGNYNHRVFYIHNLCYQ